MSFSGIVNLSQLNPLPAIGAVVTGLFTSGTRVPRRIGSMTADITVEEEGTDEIVVTEHPVEQGASINDHSYKRPSRLRLMIAFSESKGARDMRAVYQELLRMQNGSELLDVETGKRSYTAMAITSVQVTNDQTTEHALYATLTLQQIIQAKVTVGPTSKNVQGIPAKTAPTQAQGTVQAAPSGG